jgi:hypothetical protein
MSEHTMVELVFKLYRDDVVVAEVTEGIPGLCFDEPTEFVSGLIAFHNVVCLVGFFFYYKDTTNNRNYQIFFNFFLMS